MQSKFLILLSLLLAYSCSKDGDVPGPYKSFIDVLSNTWIYEEPENGVWEKDRFTPSGIFYSTYTLSAYGISENVSGNYSIMNGNQIIGQYRLSSGTQMNLDWTINDLNELQMTYTQNTVGGLRFTVNRLLAELNMNYGETMIPDYKSLIPGEITIYHTYDNPEKGCPQIQGFSSRNNRIATVNAATGEIKAVSKGRTYVEVISNLGTAVIEVNVISSLLGDDYEGYVGITKEQVKATFGNQATIETKNRLIYRKSSGNILSFDFNFDMLSGQVESLLLTFPENTDITMEQIEEYLRNRFYSYEQGTFINKPTYEMSDVKITLNTDRRILTYERVSHDLFPNYTPLLGKTQEEVINILGTPGTASTDRLTYRLHNDYVTFLTVAFENSVEGITNTAQTVILEVGTTANKNQIIQYLESRYELGGSSTDTDRWYHTIDGFYIINYDMNLEKIFFFPNISSAM